jgi:hypothetical protein
MFLGGPTHTAVHASPAFPTRAGAVKVPRLMPKNKRINEPPMLLELLLPLVGLLLVAVLFLPGFRQFLGTLLFLAVGFVALSLVVGMGLFIRHQRQLAKVAAAGDTSAPPAVSGDTWTLELLAQLEWKRFAELATAYSRELGYEAKTTGAADGGPVPLFKSGGTQPAILMQCRAWDAVTVGVVPVRELHGVMVAAQVGYGVFYTPGDFTAEATAFARGKILDLVDGREFLHRLQQLPPTVQQKLQEEATQGDYTSPTCPGCDIKMVPSTDGDRPAEGGNYWVCRNAPQCLRSLRVA